ncbi:MAG: hypothetical protein JWP78_2735 [Mucilaginibacter sp.]|nr:hypothetical protein [Mucilaginibacter sp.]
MKVEDPNALRFILQDDIYLLKEDKDNYNNVSAPLPQIETPQVNFNYLGANKKNFLILVNYPEHEFIADDHLTALESILIRKGRSRDDVAIFNIAKISPEYQLLTAYFKPRILLILGQQSIPAGMKHPAFNRCESNEGMQVLYTFSFDAMMSNTDHKKAFWDQMKTL